MTDGSIIGCRVNIFLKDNFKFSGTLKAFEPDHVIMTDDRTGMQQVLNRSDIRNIEVRR